MQNINYSKMAKPVLGLIIVLLLALFSNSSITNNQSTEKEVLSEKSQIAAVTRVIDGDTIEVSLDGKLEKIRLIGINAPESKDPRREVECFGIEASNKLNDLAKNKNVILESDPSQSNRDRYNRLLRYVYIDEEDIGFTLISEGYAYEYTYSNQYQNQHLYLNAQRSAEEDKKGLWSDESSCSEL